MLIGGSQVVLGLGKPAVVGVFSLHMAPQRCSEEMQVWGLPRRLKELGIFIVLMARPLTVPFWWVEKSK